MAEMLSRVELYRE